MASYGQLLDAPAFDDATLFDQVDIQPSTSQEQKEEAKQDKTHTQITVDDPVKRTEQTIIPGMSGGYVTYRISTTTNLPSYAKKAFSVRRRFRDLVVRSLLDNLDTSFSCLVEKPCSPSGRGLLQWMGGLSICSCYQQSSLNEAAEHWAKVVSCRPCTSS